MGQQLGRSESFTIIVDAIKATGENFDRVFYHDQLVPESLGFSVTIVDINLAKEISKVSKNFNDDDFAFTLNIPYKYFNDDPLPGDAKLGIDSTTHIEVKAELRCMALIAKTYEKWIKDNKVFTCWDLLKIINEAIDKLKKLKKLAFYFHGYKKEITEEHVSVWLAERHVPRVAGEEAEFFNVALQISDYYTPIGEHEADSSIGVINLRKMSRKEVCLLRVAHTIYSAYLDWTKQNWPDVYDDYVRGKF